MTYNIFGALTILLRTDGGVDNFWVSMVIKEGTEKSVYKFPTFDCGVCGALSFFPTGAANKD